MDDGDLSGTQTRIVSKRRKFTKGTEHPSVVQLDAHKFTRRENSVVGREKVGQGVGDGSAVGVIRSEEKGVGAVLAQELTAHAARTVSAPNTQHFVGVSECEAKLFGMNGQLWDRKFNVVPLKDVPVHGLDGTSDSDPAVGCNRPFGGVACTIHGWKPLGSCTWENA